MKTLVCILFVLLPPVSVFAEEPDIMDVQKAALDYARIRPDELSNLKKRARMAAMLPRLQLGMDKSVQNDVDISISDSVSVTSGGVNVGPEASDVNQSADSDTSFEVKAVWYLNELIFNRDALDIAEEARYQVRERRMILAEVNKFYFKRQKLLKEVRKEKDFFRKEDIEMRLDEVTADLDALTGGWFSYTARQ